MSELELSGIETEEVPEDVSAIDVPEGGAGALIVAHVNGQHVEFVRSFPTLTAAAAGLVEMAAALGRLAAADEIEDDDREDEGLFDVGDGDS